MVYLPWLFNCQWGEGAATFFVIGVDFYKITYEDIFSMVLLNGLERYGILDLNIIRENEKDIIFSLFFYFCFTETIHFLNTVV